MKHILILYYSGVGNTKYVANLIHSNLSSFCRSDLYSIEHLPIDFDIKNYDAMVIGFPTIHAEPAIPIKTFIQTMSSLKRNVPAFLFTTCGLFSANTLRIFGFMCMDKNINPILNQSFRCAATDGILLAPFMPNWFKHERNLTIKARNAALQFLQLLETDYQTVIPRLKLYSILNYPNKKLGQRFPFPIYLHKDTCSRCQTCSKNCPSKALTINTKGYPIYEKDKCVHCLRCIHHCPNLALSISSKKTTSKTLFNY
jgi:ferredoxin/flavodoxin